MSREPTEVVGKRKNISYFILSSARHPSGLPFLPNAIWILIRCWSSLGFCFCSAINGKLVSPQNSYVEILPTLSVGIKRWGLWRGLDPEGRTPMNGISALLKVAP